LILRLKAGDLGALGELYDHHSTQVYRTALAITCNPKAAEVILQDCFLSLNRHCHSIEPRSPLKSWLMRKTVKRSYKWAKQRIRWPIARDWPRQHPNDSSPNSTNIDDDQSLEALISAIAGLEINQRIAVVLHYYNSLSIDEIAEILGCTPGTVKSRLHYGRENLRRQLDTSKAAWPKLRAGLVVEVQELFFRNKEI